MVSKKELIGSTIQQLQKASITNAQQEAALLFELAAGEKAFAAPVLVQEEVAKTLKLLCEKRCTGFPLQDLWGHWPFLDLELAVGPGVLIPRQDTEVVCLKAIELCARYGSSPRVLDLCSGTGALALGIKSRFPQANITAVELSLAAYEYLKKNADGKIKTVQADVFLYQSCLPDESVDLITANPPYLTAAAMQQLQREVQFEPALALFGGEDGLDFYRHIAAAYREALVLGGALVFEIGYDQCEAVVSIMEKAGYKQVNFCRDYGGQSRCVWGFKQASSLA